MTADIDREKLRRPTGNNSDEWHIFLSELLTNRADSPNGLPYMAVQIAESIDEQIATQLADRNMTICMQAAKIAELEAHLQENVEASHRLISASSKMKEQWQALTDRVATRESERDQLRKQVEGLKEALSPFARPSIPAYLPDNLWTTCRSYRFDSELMPEPSRFGIKEPELVLWLDGHPISDFRRARAVLSALEQKEQG